MGLNKLQSWGEIVLLGGIFLISSCFPKSSSSSPAVVNNSSEVIVSGMKYKTIGVTTINITKDSLQVLYLKSRE